MDIILMLFMIFAPLGFLTLLETMILKENCKKVLKYLILLKILEFFYFLSSDGLIWLIICIIIYFSVLIFDFYKKTINIKEFTISIIFYFIDIILSAIIAWKIMSILPMSLFWSSKIVTVTSN